MILLTGGSGLLGQELQKLLVCYAPPRQVFDITAPDVTLLSGIDMIVHCAAYTDVAKAESSEDEVWKCHQVNVDGTRNMAKLGLPLVYISTEYVFFGNRGDYQEEDEAFPANWYGQTKLRGELEAKGAPKWLVIRTAFKARPFKHPKAVTDQWTSGDYVDVIAPLIARAVGMFRAGQLEGVIHIGTGKKNTFDLAKQSRDVEPITRDQIPVNLPRDASLNCAKWEARWH